MIEAHTAKDVAATYKACVRTWRLQCQAVIDRLEEGGSRLFTFLQSPPDQGKSIRTTNALERRPEACKRRIQTPCLLPCAETTGLRFWALLASG